MVALIAAALVLLLSLLVALVIRPTAADADGSRFPVTSSSPGDGLEAVSPPA